MTACTCPKCKSPRGFGSEVVCIQFTSAEENVYDGTLTFTGHVIGQYTGFGGIPMMVIAKPEKDGSYSFALMEDDKTKFADIFVPIMSTSNEAVVQFLKDADVVLHCLFTDDCTEASIEAELNEIIAQKSA